MEEEKRDNGCQHLFRNFMSYTFYSIISLKKIIHIKVCRWQIYLVNKNCPQSFLKILNKSKSPCKPVNARRHTHTHAARLVCILVWHSLQSAHQLPAFTISAIQQRNSLQQECGFKEVTHVYVVVFVQARPWHCSTACHLRVPRSPLHLEEKWGVFIWPFM